MNEIDHEYTDNIVCPFCGAEDGDSWECMPDETDLGRIECWECGRMFGAERIISVEYSTYKVDWLWEWEQYNNNKISNRQFLETNEKWKLKNEGSV